MLVTLHQVDYALSFCPRTIALKHGRVVYDGPSAELTPAFLKRLYGTECDSLFARQESDIRAESAPDAGSSGLTLNNKDLPCFHVS